MGIMVPWATQESGKLVLVGSKAELKEALHRLHRIGYEAGRPDAGDLEGRQLCRPRRWSSSSPRTCTPR